jgi:hypothetical protein
MINERTLGILSVQHLCPPSWEWSSHAPPSIKSFEVLTYVNLLWPAWDWLLLLEFHPHSGLTMY